MSNKGDRMKCVMASRAYGTACDRRYLRLQAAYPLIFFLR
eukprot:CAMPEP_0119373308 /NCGR_PEP_ID=MMETSP1334-20130426/24920_1 /TAXON_ID=127549 /ORGANISM="Calcidiscus leptoporus, Strain RCC1130" /LENGTH=39 /DNA_ID= /DNA_START= /DNA_END= /DNA_ORIENTATION=